MYDAFDENEARALVQRYSAVPEALALRTYTSRLIGRNPDLVLDGGGNTSLKLVTQDILGDDQEALFVKASGADLASIEPEDFVAVDLASLRRLRRLW